MKKTILILVVLAMLVPASALAATEFSLGGFIKVAGFWDSTQNAQSPTAVIQRNNDALFHHGNFDLTAQESRFNFTIKGPKLWGATTTGFIEIDFDALGDNNFSAANGAVGNPAPTSPYSPRLRHAMFRMNWPETELLLGQYWGMFSEYAPETAGDTNFGNHGFPNQRQPQIRLTQKFAGDWTVAGAIMKPYDPSTADSNFGTVSQPTGSSGNQLFNTAANGGLAGRSSETPQFQGKLAYEKDLYGKAAFYGRPRGFVAQVNAAWQRTRYQSNAAFTTNGVITNGANLSTFGQNAFGSTGSNAFQNSQQYLDPWCVQGTLFIPVLPTHSANLAGTASLTAQWFLGQGVSFVGAGRDNDNSWFDFSGIKNVNGQPALIYDRKLTQQFGGYFQGQYWFTNQWYMNLTWGLIRDYGFDTSQSALLQGFNQNKAGLNTAGYKYASNNDQVKLWQEFDATLWYRPIEAIKFGLQYAYERTDFLQRANNPTVSGAIAGPGGLPVQAQGSPSAGAKDTGESHRIMFAAFMFF